VGTQGSAATLQQHIADCLILSNEEEIALSRYAIEHTDNEDIRNFAHSMIEDHTNYVNDLRRFATPGQIFDLRDRRYNGQTSNSSTNRSSTNQSSTSGTSQSQSLNNRSQSRNDDNDRSDRSDRNDSRTNDSDNNRSAVENRSQNDQSSGGLNQGAGNQNTGNQSSVNQSNGRQTVTTNRFATGTATGDSTGSTADLHQLFNTERRIKQECLKIAKEDLSKLHGSDFDGCFLGMQIGMHNGMLAKLRVAQTQVSGSFAQVLRRGEQTTQEHKSHAEHLKDSTKSHSSDSSTHVSGSSSSSSRNDTSSNQDQNRKDRE